MRLKELNHLKVIGRRKSVDVGSVRKLPASTASLLNKPFISSLHESGVCLKKPKEASCCTEFLLNLYQCYHPARSAIFFLRQDKTGDRLILISATSNKKFPPTPWAPYAVVNMVGRPLISLPHLLTLYDSTAQYFSFWCNRFKPMSKAVLHI